MADPPGKGWTDAHDALANAQGFGSWDAWCTAIEEELGWKICGAKGGRQDEDGPGYPWRPCRRQAGWGLQDQDWGRCRQHGGAAGNASIGPANNQWVDGRSSKAVYRLRGGLADTYARLEETLEDVFDLGLEAKVLQARMVQLLEDMPETPVTPTVLGEVVDDVLTALRGFRQVVRAVVHNGGDPQRLVAALQELEETMTDVEEGPLSHAQLQAKAWKEWHDLVRQKRLVTRTQSLQEARRYGPVTWADVLVLVDRVRVGVLQYVPDDDKPQVIRYFRGLMERPGSGPPN